MLDMRLRLPELMAAAGIKTAYTLAKRSNGAIPLTTARRLVKGQLERIEFATLDAICDTLGAKPSELLERDKKPRR